MQTQILQLYIHSGLEFASSVPLYLLFVCRAAKSYTQTFIHVCDSDVHWTLSAMLRECGD